MRKKPKKEFKINIEEKWPAYDSDSGIKERIPAGILHGLLLCTWSIGWLGWMCGNVGLRPDYVKLIGIAAVLGILIEMMNVMKRDVIMFNVGAVILAVIGCMNRTSVFSGYNAWAEGLERAVSNYYQINLDLVIRNTDTAENLIFYGLILAILLLLINFTTITFQSNHAAILLTALAFIMSLLIDGFPDIKIMCAVLIALGGLIAFDSVDIFILCSVMTRKALRAGTLAAVMTALVLAFSYWLSQSYAADYMHSQYAYVKDYPQRMMAAVQQAFEGFLGDSDGHLTNQPPVQSDKVMLKIWTDQKPESAVYLKEFSGVVFNTATEQWAVITDEGLEKDYQRWSSSDEWIYDEAKLLWAQQLYTCLSTLKGSSAAQNYVISNVAADDQCTWAPYGVDMSGLQMEGDSYIKASSADKFKGYAMADSEELLSEGSGVDVYEQDTADLFRDYESYVYANYLTVPDDIPSLKQAVESIQSENGNLTAAQWVTQIQNILQETCTYDKSGLESVPEGSNIIEDFFGRQRKGYCIHFASAGVMMLRLAGIPARYVSGYVVWPGDFKSDTSLGGFTADVTGYRGHAWAEVYDSNQGVWVPVDMTPSDGAMAQNHPPAEETDAVSTENTDSTEQSSTETAESVTEPSETYLETEKQTAQTGDTKQVETEITADQNNQNGANHGRRFPVWLVVLAAALAAVGGYGYYNYRRHQNPIRRYSRVNRNKALLSMWQQLTEDLDKAGIRPKMALDDWSYIEWLRTQIQKNETDEQNQHDQQDALDYLMEKLHQAAFSEEMLAEEEYEQCVQICNRIRSSFEKRS